MTVYEFTEWLKTQDQDALDGTGYGEAYGAGSFFRVTVTDPVSGDVETKDIVPAVADTITSVDLA